MSITFLVRRLFPKDWKPVQRPVPSPDGRMLAIPMFNRCVVNRLPGRFVTLEIRNSSNEFVHAIQSGVAASEHWEVGWRDNNTVVVSGSGSGEWGYGVGVDSLYHPERHPPYPGWTAEGSSS